MCLRIGELFDYMFAALFIGVEIPFKHIRKEKDPQYRKQYK